MRKNKILTFNEFIWQHNVFKSLIIVIYRFTILFLCIIKGSIKKFMADENRIFKMSE